ncbi:hypothetical protein O4J56_14955 [Nocardiopsis sp. RSe5-2]|uniref:Uncharacterized protein n=1 Tax=Nocardiopsis endophytica TaxID=3018445 RepID=A0ABT4U5F2_9ACTN|nr:hypothetical protein [Nocardiopsis endophytica]MDA2811941.1 hypothetical protein [Nocardiopsis endophytica]
MVDEPARRAGGHRSGPPLILVLLTAVLLAACTPSPTADEGAPAVPSPDASASPPPDVSEAAPMADERRLLVEALWEADGPGDADLAVRIASADAMTASAVEDGTVPEDWTLLLFQDTANAHGAAVYAVVGPEGEAMVLSADPAAYQEFARAAGVRVESADDALATAEFFLDKTRALGRHQVVLESPEDALLSRLASDTSAAEEQLKQKVKPPAVKETRKGHQVTLYVQRADKVERWKGTVTQDGGVDGKFTPVIEGLPVDFRT